MTRTKETGLSYRDAGVDIQRADAFVEQIRPLIAATHKGRVVPATEAFAGLVRAGTEDMSEPLIAATCDGVGTKLLVALQAGWFEGLGQDLVAMNVNDLLPVGARPLLFLDYLATGSLEPGVLAEVVGGAARACSEIGCIFLGGETAEMPGLYARGHFDLAGFAVGVVDRQRVPRGSVQAGDVVLALPSSGVHSNGLSLARAALFDQGGLSVDSELEGLSLPLGRALLEPTRLYVTEVMQLLLQTPVKASAHITGGGLLGRLEKLLPEKLGMRIDPAAYERPTLFDHIQIQGQVSDHEMARTFNMGLGYVIVMGSGDAKKLTGDAGNWMQVGEITDTTQGVDLGYARS